MPCPGGLTLKLSKTTGKRSPKILMDLVQLPFDKPDFNVTAKTKQINDNISLVLIQALRAPSWCNVDLCGTCV